jgi:putative cardiolipin synthase
MHYRVPLLEAGVELYEMRARPGTRRGSGESKQLTETGNYSLHAKLMVFDSDALYVGSMNFDQRSRWLNTENGLIVHSPELAGQTLRRFAAMTDLKNAYAVTLESGSGKHLVWRTQEGERTIAVTDEAARSAWQKAEVHVLTWLPIDREL